MESDTRTVTDRPRETPLFRTTLLVICIAHVPLVSYLLWVGSAPIVLAGLQALLVCGTALLALHFLGKHKQMFRADWF